MPYTPTGPFVDGSPPGMSAAFFNNVENWIVNAVSDSSLSSTAGILTMLGAKINTPAVSVSGSVSGTASLYEILQGTVKAGLIYWNGYRSGGAQTMALPTALTATSYWWVSETQGGTLEALLSGTAQTFSVVTALALGGGTQQSQSYLKQHSQGMCRTGFDTVRITVTSSVASGIAFFIGV